ncbi:MAG: hypothetical protein ACOCRD_00880 [Halorubrum sp.]
MPDDTISCLRQGIDASAKELGEQIGEDMPSTSSEIRSELTSNLDELVSEAGGQADTAVREPLAESPISRYLEFSDSGLSSSNQ